LELNFVFVYEYENHEHFAYIKSVSIDQFIELLYECFVLDVEVENLSNKMGFSLEGEESFKMRFFYQEK